MQPVPKIFRGQCHLPTQVCSRQGHNKAPKTGGLSVDHTEGGMCPCPQWFWKDQLGAGGELVK